jgi:SAM-dependent methyltransferase
MSEKPRLADDPFNGRRPTSHEQQSGQPWDASYSDGPAPWDCGVPQPAVVRLAAAGGFTGSILDAGCGTGENALHLAGLGFGVFGMDVAQTAVSMARQKAADRGVAAEFAVLDAFELGRLGRTFDTVLDCGLFHTFNADEQREYVASVASVLRSGGTLQLLCLSDVGANVGPHPVSQETLSTAFNSDSGWNIAALEPERIQTRFHDEAGAPAWLATIKRI